MTHSISVGVFDWLNFPSQQDFYPEDIPQEWKLAYYSNEFNSACLSLAGLESRIDEVMEWMEDLPESFELSLYMDHSSQIPILQSLQQAQACAVNTLVLDTHQCNNLLHNVSLQAVLSCSSFERTARYEFSDIWRPDERAVDHHRIAIFPALESMRQKREWIDQWLKDSESDAEAGHNTLWLSGAETSYQQLTEMRTLIELMGY